MAAYGTLSEADLENQLLKVLKEEAEACASLLSWAQEAQRALLAMDPERVAEASRQQLKTLSSFHRAELARRAILMAWADRHKMAFPTVTVTDVASRVEPSTADQLLRLVQAVVGQLMELSLVNQCNKALVSAELELRRAIWQRVTRDEMRGTVYGPAAQRNRDPGSGRLVERQA
ncbi:MAG: flagellar export chaperone FlgN [Anaerolineae bacterium]|nr:flagellar export chaperone FlgN [Anaerolineae bacterium]